MDTGQARRDFIIDETTAFKFREIRRGKLCPRSIAVLQLRRMIYTRVIKQNGSAHHSIRYLWSASERSQFFRTSWETTIQVPGTHIAFLTLTETKSAFELLPPTYSNKTRLRDVHTYTVRILGNERVARWTPLSAWNHRRPTVSPFYYVPIKYNYRTFQWVKML